MSNFRLFLFGVSVLLVFGCKSSQEVRRVKTNIPKLTAEEILTKNSENPRIKSEVAIKSKAYFKSPKLSGSFKMHIRLKRDSVIWISATYYNVEILRFLFTKDSVKMIDRKNERYFIGDYQFIHKKYNAPINFFSLQAILLGESYTNSNYKKRKATVKKGSYAISSIKEIEKVKSNKNGGKKLQEIFTEWFSGENFLLLKQKVEQPKLKKSFTSIILERTDDTKSKLPKKIMYLITDNEKIELNAENLRISFPSSQTYPLTISSKYELLF